MEVDYDHCRPDPASTAVLLNEDLIAEILSYLNPLEIIRCACVGVRWKMSIEKDLLWKKLCDIHHLTLDILKIKAVNPYRKIRPINSMPNEYSIRVIQVENSEKQLIEVATLIDTTILHRNEMNRFCFVTPEENYLNSVITSSNGHIVSNYGAENRRPYISCIASQLLKDRSKSGPGQPQFIILNTSGLALPGIYYLARNMVDESIFRIAMLSTATPIQEQNRHLQEGVEIVLATPSKLIDLINRGLLNLRNLKYLVIEGETAFQDEAYMDLTNKLNPQTTRVLVLAKDINNDIDTFAQVYLQPSAIYLNCIKQTELDPHFEICAQYNSYRELFWQQRLNCYCPFPMSALHPSMSNNEDLCINQLRTTALPGQMVYIRTHSSTEKDWPYVVKFAELCRDHVIHPNLAAMTQVQRNKSNVHAVYENSSLSLVDLMLVHRHIFTEQIISDALKQILSAFDWLEDYNYYLSHLFSPKSVRVNLLKTNKVQVKLVNYLDILYYNAEPFTKQAPATKTTTLQLFVRLSFLFLTGSYPSRFPNMKTVFSTLESEMTSLCDHLSTDAKDFLHMLLVRRLTYDVIKTHRWICSPENNISTPLITPVIFDRLKNTSINLK